MPRPGLSAADPVASPVEPPNTEAPSRYWLCEIAKEALANGGFVWEAWEAVPPGVVTHRDPFIAKWLLS